MASANSSTITYTRGTTYSLTHTYTAPTYLGTKLWFVVKTASFDADPTDTNLAVMTPKVINMTGSAFPQTTAITIAPTDVPVSVVPGNYFYGIKVKDSNGEEFLVQSGSFVLKASPINET